MNTREIIDKAIYGLNAIQNSDVSESVLNAVGNIISLLSSLPTQGKVKSAEEILAKCPSVKLGRDDHYGRQTVLRALNEALSQLSPNNEAMAPQSQGAAWLKHYMESK